MYKCQHVFTFINSPLFKIFCAVKFCHIFMVVGFLRCKTICFYSSQICNMISPRKGYYAPTYSYYVQMRLNQICLELNWQFVTSCKEMPA